MKTQSQKLETVEAEKNDAEVVEKRQETIRTPKKPNWLTKTFRPESYWKKMSEYLADNEKLEKNEAEQKALAETAQATTERATADLKVVATAIEEVQKGFEETIAKLEPGTSESEQLVAKGEQTTVEAKALLANLNEEIEKIKAEKGKNGLEPSVEIMEEDKESEQREKIRFEVKKVLEEELAFKNKMLELAKDPANREKAKQFQINKVVASYIDGDWNILSEKEQDFVLNDLAEFDSNTHLDEKLTVSFGSDFKKEVDEGIDSKWEKEREKIRHELVVDHIEVQKTLLELSKNPKNREKVKEIYTNKIINDLYVENWKFMSLTSEEQALFYDEIQTFDDQAGVDEKLVASFGKDFKKEVDDQVSKAENWMPSKIKELSVSEDGEIKISFSDSELLLSEKQLVKNNFEKGEIVSYSTINVDKVPKGVFQLLIQKGYSSVEDLKNKYHVSDAILERFQEVLVNNEDNVVDLNQWKSKKRDKK